MGKTTERSRRRVYQGRVVSDKTDKTITAVVDTYKSHPVYKKHIKYPKKYYVRDVSDDAKVGDTAHIMETHPPSCQKRYRLVKIAKRRI